MSELSRKQILDSRVLADQEYKVIAAKHNEQNRKIIVQFDFFLADSTFDLDQSFSFQIFVVNIAFVFSFVRSTMFGPHDTRRKC